MNRLVKTIATSVLLISATATFAKPSKLTTYNMTPDVSSAFIAGVVPPQHPAQPGESSIPWLTITLACKPHAPNGLCPALVRMQPANAPAVDVGWVSLNLETGAITPAVLSANGYTVRSEAPTGANQPVKVTITKG